MKRLSALLVLALVLLGGSFSLAKGDAAQEIWQHHNNGITTSGSVIDDGGDGNGCSYLDGVVEGDWEPNYVNNYKGWAYVSCKVGSAAGGAAAGAAIGASYGTAIAIVAGAAVGAAIGAAASELPCDEYYVDEHGWERIRVQDGEKRPLDYYVGKYNSSSGTCYVAWDHREWIYR